MFPGSLFWVVFVLLVVGVLLWGLKHVTFIDETMKNGIRG